MSVPPYREDASGRTTLATGLHPASSGSAATHAPPGVGTASAPAPGPGPGPAIELPSFQETFLLHGSVADLNTSRPEADDDLHNPHEKPPRWSGLDLKGFVNLLVLVLVFLSIFLLFVGYPIISNYVRTHQPPLHLNSSGQAGDVPIPQLIDPDTPPDAHSWTSAMDKSKYKLVFSDEFEQDGRTFWPGDDPFWEAVDIFYAATNDYEWYSPEAINTTGGALQLLLTEKETHNLHFQSGMLQSWNKLCFQGGYIEMSALLPGREDTRGFWPGLWTMGNLGRPGYLGSTDGMWPYSYSACDWGTLSNQTNPNGTAPHNALHAHGPYSYQYDYKLSFLPGQRASACTCPGEDHPGPRPDIGRSAPEVDIIEAQNSDKVGKASQSLQVAPYDNDYWWHNQSATFWGETEANDYTGSVYQEAVSGLAPIPAHAYIDSPRARYTTFGFELTPDFTLQGGGSITWYIDGKRTWHAPASVVQANSIVNISRRDIPVEPMSIIINLGLSPGFQQIYFDEITFPAKLRVDYVRLYQKAGEPTRLSCDPEDYPTKKYIEDHATLYYNPNHSIFPKDLFDWPKNRLLEPCK